MDESNDKTKPNMGCGEADSSTNENLEATGLSDEEYTIIEILLNLMNEDMKSLKINTSDDDKEEETNTATMNLEYENASDNASQGDIILCVEADVTSEGETKDIPHIDKGVLWCNVQDRLEREEILVEQDCISHSEQNTSSSSSESEQTQH